MAQRNSPNMYRKQSKNIVELLLFFSLILFGSAYSLPSLAQLKVLQAEQKRYPINNKQLNESSGLACSGRDKNIIWSHNDSGHMPIIYALDTKGNTLQTFHLADTQSNDWEDMDAFQYRGKHHLLIADTGDNLRFRWDYQIIVIEEPEVNSGPDRKTHSAISPLRSFIFRYENAQSYDVEAVAVDSVHEKIYLLTKRTAHAYLFELPLNPEENGQLPVALKVAEFNEIVNPTALDISADGKILSINTYARIHRFYREPDANRWRYTHSLKYRYLFQPEGMCLDKDEKYYYVSSEKKPFLLKINAR